VKLEELYSLRDTAEVGIQALKRHAEVYERSVEDYSHSREGESILEEGYFTSEEMVRELTKKTVEMIPKYQEMIMIIDLAKEEVDKHSDFRYFNGEKVDTDRLENDLSDLRDEYKEVLETIWRTGYRIKEHSELKPNPIDMRLKNWRRDHDDREWIEDVGPAYSRDEPRADVLGDMFS